MKKNKIFKIIFVTALTMVSAIDYVALADNQSDAFISGSGGSGSGCTGTYTGQVKMTNSAGTFWITPPTNTTSGTFTDTSGFGTNYVSVARVSCTDLSSWCDTNSITFPASNSKKYTLTVYVKSATPPPTNGQPISLQVTWH